MPRIKTYVLVKIVFEADKNPTLGYLFLIFHIFVSPARSGDTMDSSSSSASAEISC